MLKRVLLSLAILIVSVFLILPALLPSEFNVERSTVIKKDRSDIYSRIVNLESWPEWDPWFEMEPTAEVSFDGIPGVVGSSSSWSGDKVGSGKQTLTKLIAPEYIQTELEFFTPQPSKATGFWTFTESPEGTLVTWGMKGKLDYPIGRLMGLFMDDMIGKPFEKGLNNLKTLAEK